MKARQSPAMPKLRGPFSRPLKVREIPKDGSRPIIQARPDECAAIATDIGLPAVEALSVAYEIQRRAGGRLQVSGQLTATITQRCVVSLEDFTSDVAQAIDMSFAPEAPMDHLTDRPETRPDRHRAPERGLPPIAGNDDQVDPPDLIIDDTIDLGAIAVEFLVLSLDLYPKKPGVAFADLVDGVEGEAEPSPFAALARLKDRL